MLHLEKILDFWKSTFQVLQGVAIAKLLPIIAYLFFVRWVGPTAFGEFSIWLGFVLLGGVIASFQLEHAFILEEQGDRRFHIFCAVVQIILFVAIFVLLIFPFLLPIFKRFDILYPTLLWLIIPGFLGLSMNNCLQALAIADGQYLELNRLRILHASVTVSIQCGLIFWIGGAIAITVGFIIGQFIACIYVFLKLRHKNPRFVYFKDCISYIKKHWRFSVFSLPANGLSSLGALLPVLLTGIIFGNTSAGYLALTIRVLQMPVNFVGTAIRDVYKRQAFIRLQETGNCTDLYKAIVMMLLPIIIIMIATMYWGGPYLFVLIFGEEWRISGEFAQTLVFAFGLSIIAAPLSGIIYLVSRQYIDLIWQAILVMLIFSSFLSSASVDIYQAVDFYTISYALMYMIYLVISYSLSKGRGYHG